MCKVLGLLSILLCFAAPPLQAQCESLTKWGVWEVRTNSSDDTIAMSYLNWLYNMNFSSAEEAHKATTDVSAMYEAAWTNLNIQNDDHSWSQFKSELATLERRQFYAHKIARSDVRTASKPILDAVRACLDDYGVHAWLQSAASPGYFTLRVSYRPDDDVIAKFEDFHAISATCSPPIFKGLRIKNGPPTNFLCTRKAISDHDGAGGATRTGFAAVVINLNTDPRIAGDFDLSLPEVLLPAAGPVVVIDKPFVYTARTNLYQVKEPPPLGPFPPVIELPRCAGGMVTDDPGYKENGFAPCEVTLIGTTVNESQDAVEIYTSSVKTGVVAADGNFLDHHNPSIGFLMKKQRTPRDVPVYRGLVANCNAGMVLATTTFRNCASELLGYVAAP